MRKTSWYPFVYSLPLCSLLLVGACGLDIERPPTDVGARINIPAMHTLVLQNEGSGTLAMLPAGSTCLYGERRHSVTFGSQMLNWTRCVGSATMAYHEVSGKHLFTTQEYYDFQNLLNQLIIVKADTDNCLINVPVLSATSFTTGGDQKYVDDGSQCAIKDLPLVQRSAIDNALAHLDGLAGP